MHISSKYQYDHYSVNKINGIFVLSTPSDIDPNGENGEYHTFCYDEPIFRYPVRYHFGKAFSQSYDVRLEDGTVKTYSYWFANLEAETSMSRGEEHGTHQR